MRLVTGPLAAWWIDHIEQWTPSLAQLHDEQGRGDARAPRRATTTDVALEALAFSR